MRAVSGTRPLLCADWPPDTTIELISTPSPTRSIRCDAGGIQGSGKEPNAYPFPAPKALCRRAVQGQRPLRTLAVNRHREYNSVIAQRAFHRSLRCPTASRGSSALPLTLGARFGRADRATNPEAIGRGLLNIESLTVYRDACGGIGTPTSDNDGTALRHVRATCLLLPPHVRPNPNARQPGGVSMLADLAGAPCRRHRPAPQNTTAYENNGDPRCGTLVRISRINRRRCRRPG